MADLPATPDLPALTGGYSTPETASGATSSPLGMVGLAGRVGQAVAMLLAFAQAVASFAQDAVDELGAALRAEMAALAATLRAEIAAAILTRANIPTVQAAGDEQALAAGAQPGDLYFDLNGFVRRLPPPVA
jgi:hypothetical protein